MCIWYKIALTEFVCLGCPQAFLISKGVGLIGQGHLLKAGQDEE